MAKSYLSTTEYAREHRISKMQVIRLIRTGKVGAERVGRDWMIAVDQSAANQIGMEKTTSLQKWNKIIKARLHHGLKIEESKDREIIYARLHGLGLPHERCIAFGLNSFPTRKDFEIAVGRLGTPYWISAVPDPTRPNLDRQTKLRIYDIDAGWNFINKLPEKSRYKIIISQYPEDPEFKGTVLISPKGCGVAEFITGDRHYILSRGFTLTDPMLFNQEKVVRFSKTIFRSRQKTLYNLVRGVYGHMELQYGRIGRNKSITFMDYNDEEAYVEIDHLWQDVTNYFKSKKHKQAKYLYGLPASAGRVSGKCIVVHHENVGMFSDVRKGDIIVSDTTTPEMTVLLFKAAAVITDLGGVTSHAAIVCRELKIPAIVGMRNATERLKSGQRISVDAHRGEVEILD